MKKLLFILPVLILVGAGCTEQSLGTLDHNTNGISNALTHSISIQPGTVGYELSHQSDYPRKQNTSIETATPVSKSTRQTIKKVYKSPTVPATDNDVYCNGSSWTPCPPGQQFYCPPAGSAQCITPQAIQAPTVSYQERCIEDGMKLIKYPDYDRLNKQQSALTKVSEGKKADITADEWAALTSTQLNAINSGDLKLLESAGDEVAAGEKYADVQLGQISNMTEQIGVMCGAISTEGQMVYELQQIQQAINRLSQ